MLQADRNKLFRVADTLDNLPRVRKPKELVKLPQISDRELLKLRMQERTKDLWIVISEDDLNVLTELIRESLRMDEVEMIARLRNDRHSC